MKRAIRHSLSVIRHSERGFTLIELLVVLAILSIIGGLFVTIIYQFLTVPRWGNAQLALDHDLRNAHLWLMRDGNESASFTPGGTCGVFDTGHGPTYTYAVSGNGLQRTDSDTGQTVEVAHHVSGLTCTTNGDQVVVALQVATGPVSVSETFTVTMRVR